MKTLIFTIISLVLTATIHPCWAQQGTLVVPPLEDQVGGKELISSLQRQANGKFFVDQKFNLDLIGRGTSVVFVVTASGGHWGFAVSNGRFEATEKAGSLENKSYPSEVAPLTGKYLWPTDYRGAFLPGEFLVPSNGPHGKIKEFLQKTFPIEDFYIAGHVGVDHNGKVFIGYTSASVNSILEKESTDTATSDKRALPASYRKLLHQAVAKAFYGRNINWILKKAPTRSEDILRGQATNHFPPQSPPSSNQVSSTHLEYLYKRLGQRGLVDYIQSLDLKILTNLTLEIFSSGRSQIIASNHYSQILKTLENRLAEVAPPLKELQKGQDPREVILKAENSSVLRYAFMMYISLASPSALQATVMRNFNSAQDVATFKNEFATLINRMNSSPELQTTIWEKVISQEWFGADFNDLMKLYSERAPLSEIGRLMKTTPPKNSATLEFFRPLFREYITSLPELFRTKTFQEIVENPEKAKIYHPEASFLLSQMTGKDLIGFLVASFTFERYRNALIAELLVELIQSHPKEFVVFHFQEYMSSKANRLYFPTVTEAYDRATAAKQLDIPRAGKPGYCRKIFAL